MGRGLRTPLGVTLKLAESPFVRLSTTGRYLYVPAGERWRLWDTRTGAPVLDISQSSDDDGQFAFTLDDRRLLTFSGGRASVWDLSTGLRLSSTAVAAQRPWFAIGPEKGQIAYADGRQLRIRQEGAADIVRTMPAEGGGRHLHRTHRPVPADHHPHQAATRPARQARHPRPQAGHRPPARTPLTRSDRTARETPPGDLTRVHPVQTPDSSLHTAELCRNRALRTR